MSVNVREAKSLWWFEPRWSYGPRLKVELSRLLQAKMWLRVLVAVIALAVLLRFVVERAIPDLEFNWAAALIQCMGVFVLIMVLMVGFLWAIPPIVHVTPKGVSRQQGQAVHWRRRADLRRIAVDVSDPARPRLHVETSGKPFEAGIAAKITPATLVLFAKRTFPELLVEERR